jgi:hypothetical protein
MAVSIVDDSVVFVDDPPRTCELCGKVAECRPYGPNGEQICFPCGEKNPAERDRRIKEYAQRIVDEHLASINNQPRRVLN